MTRWTVSPSLIPCWFSVSPSLRILPAKIRTSCSCWALNLREISSLNSLTEARSQITISSLSLGVLTVTRMGGLVSAPLGSAMPPPPPGRPPARPAPPPPPPRPPAGPARLGASNTPLSPPLAAAPPPPPDPPQPQRPGRTGGATAAGSALGPAWGPAAGTRPGRRGPLGAEGVSFTAGACEKPPPGPSPPPCPATPSAPSPPRLLLLPDKGLSAWPLFLCPL